MASAQIPCENQVVISVDIFRPSTYIEWQARQRRILPAAAHKTKTTGDRRPGSIAAAVVSLPSLVYRNLSHESAEFVDSFVATRLFAAVFTDRENCAGHRRRTRHRPGNRACAGRQRRPCDPQRPPCRDAGKRCTSSGGARL